MKKKLQTRWLQMQQVARRSPVEVTLSVLFCCLRCLKFELGWVDLAGLLSYFPVLFMVSYTLNQLTNRLGKGRSVYYLSLFFFIPFIWLGKEVWTASYLVSLVAVQILLLVSYWQADNRLFMQQAFRYLRSVLAASLLAGITWAVTASIFFSIRAIFDIWEAGEGRFVVYASSLVFMGVLPLLFLLFHDEKADDMLEFGGERLFDILLNYLLSPALLVYAAILYVYFFKIVWLWSLPKGVVAYIVVSYVTALFVLKGCQPFLRRRSYDWFYRQAGWEALLPLSLYWVGSIYRIEQYGFTEARVYLVIVGLILTGMVLFFFFKRTAHYLYVACLAVGLLSVVTYIPGVTAKDWERRSQLARSADSVGTIPTKHVMCTIDSAAPVDISAYRTMQRVFYDYENTGLCQEMKGDSLFVYTSGKVLFHKESLSRWLDVRLKDAGLAPGDEIPKEAYPQFQRMETASGSLIFGRVLLDVTIYNTDSCVYAVSHIEPGYYLELK